MRKGLLALILLLSAACSTHRHSYVFNHWREGSTRSSPVAAQSPVVTDTAYEPEAVASISTEPIALSILRNEKAVTSDEMETIRASKPIQPQDTLKPHKTPKGKAYPRRNKFAVIGLILLILSPIYGVTLIPSLIFSALGFHSERDRLARTDANIGGALLIVGILIGVAVLIYIHTRVDFGISL